MGGALQRVRVTRTAITIAVVGALVAGVLVVMADSSALSDPSAGYLDDVPSTTPSNLGDLDLTDLQYGDPTEALGLVQPPVADADGGASLAHPMVVPPGRAGVDPDLALTYDSGAGSGWTGTGWDLSVGAVTVDTEFGAPRYLATQESETYELDGARLFPNAIRTDLEARVPGPRSDWVRQLEDEHELIIRHGSSPSTYCWEVADKEGNHRWYGGEPNDDGGCTRIDSAVLTAPATGAPGGVSGDFHWGLTYVEDISGNIMRFSYDEVTGVPVGQQAESAIGVSLYLREITYTGFRWTDDADDEPAYRVRFLRDGDVDGEEPRLDVSVDASAGLPVVTRDLLRGVEVEHLSAAHYEGGAAPQRVKGWTLEYETGPFDKSLLTRVGQYGTGGAGAEHAWHEFTWFDDVQHEPATGSYVGFGPTEQWGKTIDSSQRKPNIAAESALGTSWRAGGDGGAYIGFNPVIPSKVGSFGGSFNIAGGESNETSTLIDLNGDSLPDKVWVEGSGDVVYRPNLRTPNATDTDKYANSWFGEKRSIQQITGGAESAMTSLGKSRDLRIDIHFEAYPVVAIQVGGGFGFSFGDNYFEDANGDGRVDFIQPGSSGGHTVFYNVLVDGIPTFIDSSLADELTDRLEVPLDAFDSTAADEAVAEVADLLLNTSPRIDTVRRWLAPHTGTIRVEGSAALTEGAAYSGDGVQVSIEHDGTKRWVHALDAADASETHDETFAVTAGDPVWFRLHVIQNAAGDKVTWQPEVTYVDGAGSQIAAEPDANGRSQVAFDAGADFTLFGRSGARTGLSEPGDVTVTVDLDVAPGGLSDELRVILLHGRGNGAPTSSTVMTVPQLTGGEHAGSKTIGVTAPSTNHGPDGIAGNEDDFEESDWIEVEVVSDSPVDPTKFNVEITTSEPAPTPPPGVPAGVDIPLDIPVVPNVRVFSRTDHTSPYAPVTAPRDSTATVDVSVAGLLAGWDTVGTTTPAVLTVKTATGGVVARQAMGIDHVFQIFGTGLEGTTSVEFPAASGTKYYVELSVADPAVGAAVDLTGSTTTFRWEEQETDGDGNTQTVQKSEAHPNSGQLHWPDVDGMFPSANRGWAYAGYNADHVDADGAGPIVESQFAFEAESAGYDEDTEVPGADDAPSAGTVKGGVETSFASALPFIPWGDDGAAMADRWRPAEKETIYGQADAMQADRLGADVALPGLSTVGREAPQILSVDGDFNFMLGLVASFTAAAGGGRALKDFEDYNGDGYPDIRSGSTIEYTGPRGAKAATTSGGDNSFDTALALGGGINGSAVAISSSGGASENGDGGGAGSNVEPTSTKSSRGMNLGLGFSIGAQWTNPLANGEAYSAVSGGDEDAPDIQGDLDSERGSIDTAAGATGTPIDRALIDVNGDGLPDRVDTYTSGELWVNLNLGYRFAGDAVQWSTGRTAANKDLSGSLSVGFQLNAYEFGGGIAYSEGVGYSLFDWMDIDGDGVPDRMNNVGEGQPRTVFGSGNGMLREEVVYGTYPNGNVAVDAAGAVEFDTDGDGDLAGIDLPAGQMEVSRSTGLSGGFDFSFYIGPICVVACYIVVNPGAHAGYDRMTSQVQMVDMDGDGFLDAVRSTDYEDIEVKLNQRGRTNMLQSVTNPLGGQIRLDYERTGNTTTNPESVWVMSDVEVDDGRSGDGPDVQRSRYSYDGNVWDPLLRELLGFSEVIEEQLADDGTTVLRSYKRTYLNDSPFDSGLLVSEETYAGAIEVGEAPVQTSAFQWQLVDADPQGAGFGDAVVDLPAVNTTARLQLFDTAVSPRMVRDTLTQRDAEGDEQVLETVYTYSAIGDVTSVHEVNEDEIDADDTFTVITYPECGQRDGSRSLGEDDSWVSVPQTVAVYDNHVASGKLLRYRNGGPDLCANAAPVRIAELVQAAADSECGADLFAITEMSFDTHGNFNSVARPATVAPDCGDYPPETIDSGDLAYDGCATLSAEDDAARYCVDYVYDPHRFTDIAEVTDNHGISAGATYDPFTGRLATRTDENGNLTSYSYDAEGRLASVTAPKEQGGAPTVTYAYGGLAATLDPAGPHTWSTAHHRDVFNPGNTIDTATFVDGMGRVVQRKRDGVVEGVAGEARIVEGAIEYDALGREVKQWYPVVEQVGVRPLTAYNTWNSETARATTGVPETAPTVKGYDVLDRLRSQTLPDGSQETVDYDVDGLPHAVAVYDTEIAMSRVISTDALGKVTTRWLDVGGAVFERHDGALAPSGGGEDPLAALPSAPVIQPPRIAESVGTPGPIVTRYEYDRLGRLTAVVDVAGARTAHTYDLQDNVTSTDTPDGGLVQRTFGPSGQLLTVERAVGGVAAHGYDRDRLIAVDYSDATPDVTYEYGQAGAAENGAGRMVLVSDGSMDRAYGYDEDGNVAREAATQHPDPFGKGVDLTPASWETAWAYDSLARLALLTYPDGEELTHDYDLGGRPSRLVSRAPQHDLYDQYGSAVPRDDVEIVYIDEVRYDEFGEATYLRTGTGVETRYEHEPTRRFLASVDTDSTAVEQFDGTTSIARPLQRLEYTYDAVGNVRDVANGLYRESGDSSITDLGPAPENNVPGPSQHAYTYDGHYRLTGGLGTYIDQQERRDFTFEADHAPNGNLLSKRQVTTTTSTTSTGGGKPKSTDAGRGKKGDGSGTDGGTTDETTCESNTGSGGGSFNQDPETTYVIDAADLDYAEDGGVPTHRITRSGTRTYTHDDNGNMTSWSQPCAGGSSTISRTLEWDAENRLTRIAEGNNDTLYRYNAEGTRTLERGPGGTNWFVNEHWRTFNDGLRYANVFLGEQLVATHRTDPQPPAPPPCTDTEEVPCGCDSSDACRIPEAECDLATRTWDATTGTCQPRETRKIFFVHKDLQGSLRVATNEVGGVFQYVDYLPMGRPWVAGQSTIKDTPNLFAGGWTDMTYDLVNFGERWHDDREQNFLSTEPLLEESPYAVVDDPSLLAAYTYAASNPLKYVDSDGRAPKVASNGYDLGNDYEKHESGNISISVAKREARAAPAITFGGRYGNDAAGQALSKAFKKHADRAGRFSTILSIDTEDGVRKIRVFGVTAKKSKVGDNAVPTAAPGDTGAADGPDATAPPRPASAPPTPSASTASDAGPTASPSADAGSSADDGAAAAASPPASGDGGSSPTPPTPPPRPPRPAAPSAPGSSKQGDV